MAVSVEVIRSESTSEPPGSRIGMIERRAKKETAAAISGPRSSAYLRVSSTTRHHTCRAARPIFPGCGWSAFERSGIEIVDHPVAEVVHGRPLQLLIAART